MSAHAERWVISGQVQGVGYRDWMVRRARRADIDGWVRNLATGEVEALVSAAPELLAALRADCLRGPESARVERIATHAADAPQERGFVRRASS